MFKNVSTFQVQKFTTVITRDIMKIVVIIFVKLGIFCIIVHLFRRYDDVNYNMHITESTKC